MPHLNHPTQSKPHLQRLGALAAAAAAALLAACSTAPTVPPELMSARTAVQRASADSGVLTYGALDLQKASDALDRANRLSTQGAAVGEVSSAAYVAQRHAEAAVAIAQSKANEEAMKTAQMDQERARADANAAAAERARAEAAAAQQQADVARMRAQIARADANEATAQARAARTDAAIASAQAQTLQAQLEELQAKSTDRGMLVTLGDVLFGFGRADIQPAAQAELAKLANWLKQHPERRVRIEGYTDSVGNDAANLALSNRRAQAVAAALVALGVSADRLQFVGYGEGYPVADNSTDTNRALNRRVEVYISNNDQPVAARS